MLYALLPVVLFLATFQVFLYFIKPTVEKFVLSQLESYSEKNLAYKISAKNFDFSLVAPRALLNEVSFQPLDKNYPALTVRQIRLNLDFFQLLGGRIFFSSLAIHDVGVSLNIATEKQKKDLVKNPEIPTELIFKMLKKIPLRQINLSQIHPDIFFPDLKTRITTTIPRMSLTLTQSTLAMAIEQSQVHIVGPHQQVTDMQLYLDTLVTPKSLQIENFILRGLGSSVRLKGFFTKWDQILIKPQGNINYEIVASMAEIKTLFAFFPQIPWPALEGSLQSAGEFDFNGLETSRGGFFINGMGLSFQGFEIGKIQLSALLGPGEISIPRLEVEHSAGVAKIEKGVLKYQMQPFSAKLRLDAESPNMDIHRLLKAIHVGDLNLDLEIQPKLTCDGTLVPNLDWGCSGKIHASNLEVRSGREKSSTIVRLKKFSADGKFTVDREKVTYQAGAHWGSNHGESDGVIAYQSGFKINYRTLKPANLAEVDALSHFKVEGLADLSGTTEGNSKTATFFVDLSGQNLAFENYLLGQAQGKLRYQSGHLFFENMSGLARTSPYQAELDIDLQEATLSVTAQSTHLELADLQNALQRIATVPFEALGRGQLQVTAQGPIDLSELSYDISSHFKKVKISGEYFDDFNFSLAAEQGHVQVRDIFLMKNSSLIRMTGTVDPQGITNLAVKGEKINLEESDWFSKLGNISGLLDFDVEIRKQILFPLVNLKGHLSELALEDQIFPDSYLSFIISREKIDGSVSLLGNRLQSNFSIPFKDNLPMKFQAKAKDWNFSTFFALFGNSQKLSDYDSALTANIDLESGSGSFLKSSGQISIDQIFLQKEDNRIENKGLMLISADQGKFTSKSFVLQGRQTELELISDESTVENLNLKIKGNTSLSLFVIFFSFMEELSGLGKIDLNIKGPLVKPDILGFASLDSVYLKIKNLVHAFEKGSVQAQFSKSNVVFERIQAQFAGGKLKGDGQMEIRGPQDIPLDISADFENVSLNIPEHFKTYGNGELQISGNWFPFKLSGNYYVDRGYIDKEFGDDAFAAPSTLNVPTFLINPTIDPLELDLKVDLTKAVQIKNSQAVGQLTGQLMVQGPPQKAGLTGKINFDKATVLNVRDKSFETNIGTLQFKGEREINPILYFSARSRVSDYDVNLLVQGTAKEPLVSFSSSPPLSDKELISLLAFGATSSRLEKQAASRDQENNLSYQIGTAIVANNPVTKNIQQTLGVNFSFSSAYDDTKNISKQKATVTKPLGKNLSASASRLRGEQSSTEVKLEYSINSNVSAIATWESRDPSENKASVDTQKPTESVFGLDLDFRKEFK